MMKINEKDNSIPDLRKSEEDRNAFFGTKISREIKKIAHKTKIFLAAGTLLLGACNVNQPESDTVEHVDFGDVHNGEGFQTAISRELADALERGVITEEELKALRLVNEAQDLNTEFGGLAHEGDDFEIVRTSNGLEIEKVDDQPQS